MFGRIGCNVGGEWKNLRLWPWVKGADALSQKLNMWQGDVAVLRRKQTISILLGRNSSEKGLDCYNVSHSLQKLSITRARP